MVSMVYCRSSRACTTEYDVRLQDSLSATSGRVEVCYLGHWVNFCAEYSSESLANVVCRQLGLCDEGGDNYYYNTLCMS